MMRPPCYAIRAVGPEPTPEWRDAFVTEAEDYMMTPYEVTGMHWSIEPCQVLEHQPPSWQEPRAYFDEEIGMEAKLVGYWMVMSVAR